MMIEINAKGLLFIGDPHVSSKNIGRRLDANFCETVCGKLDQAFEIANSQGWYPIILGDLFDDENDSKARMLTRVIRSLGNSKITPLTIVGNHEKTQFYLTDDTALAAIREAKMIDTLERSGARAIVNIDGKRVLVGGTPYGQDLPSTVMELRKAHRADIVVWLTHHDLAFQGAYPGATVITEIVGVDMLVNGHMHKPTPPVKAGNMMAFNPGNITRVSIDCRDQKPSVWSWTPKSSNVLDRIELIHQEKIMNLQGYVFEEAKAVTTNEEAKAELLIQESNFARLLKLRKAEDEVKTDDAQILKEEMDALHLSMGSDDEFKAYMLEMLEESLKDDSSL
jgi:predicted phosphodiesterase